MTKIFTLKNSKNNNTMIFEDNGGDEITITAILSDLIVAYVEQLPREKARNFYKWLINEGYKLVEEETLEEKEVV